MRLTGITCVDLEIQDVMFRGDGMSYCEVSGNVLKVLTVLGLIVVERGVNLTAQYPQTTLSRDDQARYVKIANELLEKKRNLAEVLAILGLQELLKDSGLRYGLIWLLIEKYGIALFPDRRMASRVRKTFLKFLDVPGKQKVVKELFRKRGMLDVDEDSLKLIKKVIRNIVRELEGIV